jgi:hypothetical protein
MLLAIENAYNVIHPLLLLASIVHGQRHRIR